MTDFRALLFALADSGVEFIVVGGAAAIAHGVARLTLDLDIVYRRTPENIGPTRYGDFASPPVFTGSSTRAAVSVGRADH